MLFLDVVGGKMSKTKRSRGRHAKKKGNNDERK